MDKRLERGATTRDRIIDAATRLFAEEGYEAVSIEVVLQSCAISRGALYHHFGSKSEIFVAVLEAVEEQVARSVAQAAIGADGPLAIVSAGAEAWLALAASDPVVRRVILQDAPAVLGWDKWRDIEERHSLGLIKLGLSAASQNGLFPADRVDFYARSLLAILIEGALIVSRSENPAADKLRARDTVNAFLMGIDAGAAKTGL